MFVQSISPFFNRLFLATWLDALQNDPAAALLTTPKVSLFTTIGAPVNQDLQFTDIGFPLGTWWKDLALGDFGSWVVQNLGSGNGIQFVADADFTFSAADGPATVIGYVVTDGSVPPQIYICELFENPIPLTTTGDAVNLDVIFPLLFNPSAL